MKTKRNQKSRREAAPLRVVREGAGLTQQDIAARLGMDQATISRIESGQRAIKAGQVMAIAKAYGVTVDFVLRAA